MKALPGGTIISFAVAQIVKGAVVMFGTFLWIESRIPSFPSKKALVPRRSLAYRS